MVTLSKKTLVLICIGCLLAGAAYTQVEIILPTKPQRPVLTAIARFARTALWFMAFAEPPPKDEPGQHIQSVLVDENGYAHINHARGW